VKIETARRPGRTLGWSRAALAAGLIGAFGSAISACAQVSIAVGLSTPQPPAIGPTGGYLYFGQQSQATCQAELDRMPADASNGTWSTIASGLGLSDSYADCRGIGAIAFSGSKLIYNWGSYDNSTLVVANLDGSGSQTLVKNYSGGNLLGIINGAVYYTTGFSQINKIPLSGGTSTALASGYFVRSTVVDPFDGAAGAIYFVDYYSNGVWRFDAGRNSAQEIISGATQEGVIFEDTGNVYLVFSGGIFKVRKGQVCAISSTCVTLWPTPTQSGTVQSYALGKGSIFFTVGADLWRVSTSGAGATKLYSGTTPHVQAADTGFVYFTDGTQLFKLISDAGAGGKPILLSTSAHFDASTLDHGLYWTDKAGSIDGAGAVHMVVEQVSQLDSLQYGSSTAAMEAPCAGLGAIYTQLARSVLRLQNPTTLNAPGYMGIIQNITIDEFLDVTNPTSPCASTSGSGAVWAGVGSFHNPVSGAVKGLTTTNALGLTDIGSLLSTGPVLLESVAPSAAGPHWILATEQAVVSYAGATVSGVIAYDPLSGTKILLTGGGGSNAATLILDPVTSAWCGFSDPCAGAGGATLVSHINTSTMKPAFNTADLAAIQSFQPSYYRAITISP
jgi:hypothetical protein